MKKSILILVIFLISISTIKAQLGNPNDGGFLCGTETDIPVWILRIEVFDAETRVPIQYPSIKIMPDEGYGLSWKGDSQGIITMVITNQRGIPTEGYFEITSSKYQYAQIPFERDDFSSREKELRIGLEGHWHNWTNSRDKPPTQELINKIRSKQYKIGVKYVVTSGINLVNYAPACFEYSIQMKQIRRY